MLSSKFKRFVKKRWLPIGGFLLSSVIALFFSFTFLANAIYFNDPKHQDEALKDWMTPKYIVMSYDIPREIVADILGLDDNDRGKGLRLKEVAESQNLSLDQLTVKIRNVAQTYRESQK